MNVQCAPSSISNLEVGFNKVEISVRVIRKWKIPARNDDSLFYTHLILLDEENAVIQATIGIFVSRLFDKVLTEKHTYKISNFSTIPNVGEFKATIHPNRIWFDFSTAIVPEQLDYISDQYFNLKTFYEIIAGEEYNSQYIGKWLNTQIQSKMMVNKRRCLHCEMKELEMSCIIDDYLNGGFANMMKSLSISRLRPVLIFQFVTRMRVNGEICITTVCGATHVLVHSNVPFLGEFILRRNAIATTQQVFAAQDFASKPENILLMTEVQKLGEIIRQDKDGVFTVGVNIVDVVKIGRWYYEVCQICENETKKAANGLWFCSRQGCMGNLKGMHSFSPWYNLKYYISGAVGDIAKLEFTNKQVEELLERPASVLLLKQQKNGRTDDEYPIDLNILNGQEICVKIKGSRKKTIGKIIKSYKVLCVSNQKSVIHAWKNLLKHEIHVIEDSESESLDDDMLDSFGSSERLTDLDTESVVS